MKPNNRWVVIGIILSFVIVMVVHALITRLSFSRGKLLRLDPLTLQIFNHADRVDTFELQFYHDVDHLAEERVAVKQNKDRLESNYTVTARGASQNTAFAGELCTALQHAFDPHNYPMSSCFDPHVGFRVWHGREHADVFLCFSCSVVDISTTDAHGHFVWQERTDMGASRSALLSMSQQVFPKDRALHEL